MNRPRGSPSPIAAPRGCRRGCEPRRHSRHWRNAQALRSARVDTEIYERLRARLNASGLREIAAQYDHAAFGSWFITLDVTPRLRIVWDGPDRSLLIQREAQGGSWRD